jgi:hypothetical protein
MERLIAGPVPVEQFIQLLVRPGLDTNTMNELPGRALSDISNDIKACMGDQVNMPENQRMT